MKKCYPKERSSKNYVEGTNNMQVKHFSKAALPMKWIGVLHLLAAFHPHFSRSTSAKHSLYVSFGRRYNQIPWSSTSAATSWLGKSLVARNLTRRVAWKSLTIEREPVFCWQWASDDCWLAPSSGTHLLKWKAKGWSIAWTQHILCGAATYAH